MPTCVGRAAGSSRPAAFGAICLALTHQEWWVFTLGCSERSSDALLSLVEQARPHPKAGDEHDNNVNNNVNNKVNSNNAESDGRSAFGG